MQFEKVSKLFGCIIVPGDKSISHRAIMLGAIAKGTTRISNLLISKDCIATLKCFLSLGVTMEYNQNTQETIIEGKGLYGLIAPAKTIDVGNSGTTMRLLSGILVGQNFSSIVTGDSSLLQRPMDRILLPLTQMGGDIKSHSRKGYAPICINSQYNFQKTGMHSPYPSLHGITYTTPIASAQVKSCILLAGLYADTATTVIEPAVSRNHTEQMLLQFGVSCIQEKHSVSITPRQELHAASIHVPGDISSAAYFIAAALLIPHSELIIKEVGINPTRDGILEVCCKMGANIKIENRKDTEFEPYCDLHVKHSNLHGITIQGALIPRLIDELPIIAVLACFAEGETIIKDASELRVKESNRIETMVTQLKKMGADIVETQDGMKIRGTSNLHGTMIDTKGDHRIAMSFVIAGFVSEGVTTIHDTRCIDVSYPGFLDEIKRLISS